MPIISAVCSQCGAKLEVDSTLESAVCPYCETSFVIETPGDSSKKEANALAKAGDTFMKLSEYDKAESKFKTLLNKFPYDYRGWWGLVRIISKDFSDISVSKSEIDNMTELFNKAVAVAPNEVKGELQYHFENYSANMRNALLMLKNNTIAKREKLDSEYQANRNALLNQIENLTAELNKMEKMKWPSIKLTVLLVVAYIVMLVLIAQIQYFLNEIGILIILVSAGVAAYLVKKIIGGRADANFKNKKDNLRRQIVQLRAQVKAEENHYFNMINDLDKDFEKAGNV